MRVDVERQLNARVAEQRLHEPRLNAEVLQERGGGVPEVVEADVRQLPARDAQLRLLAELEAEIGGAVALTPGVGAGVVGEALGEAVVLEGRGCGALGPVGLEGIAARCDQCGRDEERRDGQRSCPHPIERSSGIRS